MDDGIKQRLIGALVLVALMIIVLPMFFGDQHPETADILIEMPAKPAIPEFDITKPAHPVGKRKAERVETEPLQQTKPLLEELTGKKVDANSLPVSWTLQVASFKERTNAEQLRNRLRQGGYKAYIKFKHGVEPKIMRVFVGPVLERKTIDGIKTAVSKQYKLDGVVVRYLP